LCVKADSEIDLSEKVSAYKEYINRPGDKNTYTLYSGAALHLFSMISKPELTVERDTEKDRFIQTYHKLYRPMDELTNSYMRIQKLLLLIVNAKGQEQHDIMGFIEKQLYE